MDKAKGLPKHLMYKNCLQEYTQKLGLPFPEYRTINEGFQHAPKFRSSVSVDGTTFLSRLTFPRLKEAEQDAAKFALECLREKMKNAECSMISKDPTYCKSILNEFAVKMNQKSPTYTTIQEEEPRPVFRSSLVFDGKTYTGEVGKSKKEAEQLAARIAIRSLLGSCSGVLHDIINTKARTYTALHKVKDSGFKESNLPIVGKPAESPPRPLNILPATANVKPLENKRKLENKDWEQKRMRGPGQ